MVAINKVAKRGLVAAMAVFLCESAFSKDITIAWNPNTERDIAGYKLYVAETGKAANAMTVTTNVANVTGLIEGRTYLMYATAFNTAGLESDPSEQISYTVPSGIPDQMDSPLKLATGGMQITSRGLPGHSYMIQATRNLGTSPWVTLQTVQPDASGIIRITDPATLARRFYRTVEVP